MLGCCHINSPKSCCDGKQAYLVLLVGGVCKFDRDHVSEVGGKLLVAISLGDAGEVCVGYLFKVRGLHQTCPRIGRTIYFRQ